jgi:hypothetical protein
LTAQFALIRLNFIKDARAFRSNERKWYDLEEIEGMKKGRKKRRKKKKRKEMTSMNALAVSGLALA